MHIYGFIKLTTKLLKHHGVILDMHFSYMYYQNNILIKKWFPFIKLYLLNIGDIYITMDIKCMSIVITVLYNVTKM
jgi:hypothetical protein